jgi:DNA polymerase IIIc chi subunit
MPRFSLYLMQASMPIELENALVQLPPLVERKCLRLTDVEGVRLLIATAEVRRPMEMLHEHLWKAGIHAIIADESDEEPAPVVSVKPPEERPAVPVHKLAEELSSIRNQRSEVKLGLAILGAIAALSFIVLAALTGWFSPR